MLQTYRTSGGKDVILDFINKQERRIKNSLIGLLIELDEDTLGTLGTLKTKKIKPTNLLEIIVGDIRMFYVVNGNEICILHICYKQKNKTEKSDINRALERLKNLK